MSADVDARAGMLKDTVRGAGWLGLGAGVVKASQTIVLLILAAILEPSALGVITIGALVLNVTGTITDFGTSTALVHWRGDVHQAARTAMTMAIGIGITLTAGMWVAAPYLSAALGSGDLGTDVVRGLMLCLPFMALAEVSQELLRRAFAFRRRVVPDIIGALAGAALSVGLALDGFGVYSLVAGQILQHVLALALLWILLPPVRPGWSRSDAAGLLRYGGNLAGANVVQLVMLNLDYVLVARILGITALGIYSMSFRIAYMPVVLVTTVVLGAAFAYLCRLEGDDLGRATGELTVALLSIVTPLYVGIGVLAPQIELLGEQWSPGVVALRWLAVYGVLASLVALAAIVVAAAGRPRHTLAINLTHLVALAVALVALTGLGVSYVAFGQVLGAAVAAGVAVVLVARTVSGTRQARVGRRLLPPAAGAVAMVVAVELVAVAVPGPFVSVVGLLVTGTVAVVAYVAALVPVARLLGEPIVPALEADA